MSIPALTPELNVSNLERSLDFYLNTLGFSIAYARPESGMAAVHLGEAYFLLEEMTRQDEVDDKEFVEQREWRTGRLEYPYGRGMNILIASSGVEALYQRVLDAGYPVKMPLETRSYQVAEKQVEVKQFMVMDPDGFLLRFDQEFDES